ncbi:HOG (high osmolarity glycerol) pathway protein [Botryosphaeria dothidea]
MAAVVSPQKSQDSASQELSPRSPQTSQSANPLPPLITSPPSKPPNASSSRPTSYAKNRLSTMSQASGAHRSRPQSTAYPVFHSSLSYTLVRDFAYPPYSPLFYGPLPEQRSETSTPVSESHSRRVSDPPLSWDGTRGGWTTSSWEPRGEQLPSTSFGDGPPWSEDEDLHSPVVTSARHRKHKSNVVGFDSDRGRSAERASAARRGSYHSTNGDGSQNYYVSDFDEMANGPGGEYITYPAGDEGSHMGGLSVPSSMHGRGHLPRRSYMNQDGLVYASEDDLSETSSPGGYADESRYSRDYQFTIASPDEEMHGKAVALFDFERENDNELPLTEGQIILVSYRHGQGWLVAQDPRTGESGLVPEEYVRLLRDIEGGWNGLMNGAQFSEETTNAVPEMNDTTEANNTNLTSPAGEALTPTQNQHHRRDASGQSGSSEYYTPVVSTFSTSSKDLEKYPQHLLGSQANTPVGDGSFPRRGSKASSQLNSPKKDDSEEKEGNRERREGEEAQAARST